MLSLRSKETEKKYQEVRAERDPSFCALCEATPLEEFTHWKILQNDFPYDEVASTHDMLVSKRHVTEGEITQEEWLEYNKIKHGYVAEKYEIVMEGTQKLKSIPDHFHVHLLVLHPVDF